MTGVCPDCGSPLPKDAALLGLCPQCLLSMALEDEENPTLQGSSPGGILGERYQIREILGRGGMGEVYRAFDLKLRVDVALKAVRPELSASDKARELLRQEVRSAREVVSPNVCRIFDLVVEDGRELVSMEYIDGTTLAETLRERGPPELQNAREVAAQFLAGLEAIHEAGLVHRDFKPENVMLTRTGRVVVMDFGLAKDLSEAKSRSIAGTPAYMSPEQSRGEGVDARSDVYSAGVVLSEMLWGGARQEVWEAVRETPPRVPEGPWAPVLREALSSERENRYPTARALARALDEVTHRLPGFEDRHPYPGLASFTKEDAEYFFGREVEVEAVWKKLKRPRLLALIGPSGAGKSSFLRAGILPTVPPGWRVILSTPGHRPFSALAESLLPAFAGDMEAIQSFLRFDEPETAISLFSAWRRKSEHALLIVDQFEELFTLNPPEVQETFAALLGRLVLEGDVHVLLSLRDDFLFHCQKHEALSPVFSELTPLGTLSPSALRRALVQPALACGYRFEDDALVEEMVSEVSHERGVLPLLAFAASRLWEKRDRERGLLTREAYREIGGVEELSPSTRRRRSRGSESRERRSCGSFFETW
jgi:serine/threonine protein kinase